MAPLPDGKASCQADQFGGGGAAAEGTVSGAAAAPPAAAAAAAAAAGERSQSIGVQAQQGAQHPGSLQFAATFPVSQTEYLELETARRHVPRRSRGTQPFDLRVVERILALDVGNGSAAAAATAAGSAMAPQRCSRKRQQRQSQARWCRAHTSGEMLCDTCRGPCCGGGGGGTGGGSSGGGDAIAAQTRLMAEMARMMRAVTGLVKERSGADKSADGGRGGSRAGGGGSAVCSGIGAHATSHGDAAGGAAVQRTLSDARRNHEYTPPRLPSPGAQPAACAAPPFSPSAARLDFATAAAPRGPQHAGPAAGADAGAAEGELTRAGLLARVASQLERMEAEERRLAERLAPKRRSEERAAAALPLGALFALCDGAPPPPAAALLRSGSTEAYESLGTAMEVPAAPLLEAGAAAQGAGEGGQEAAAAAAAAAATWSIDVSLPSTEAAEIEEHRRAFLRHRRVQESALEGTGLRQCDVVELLADDIVKDLIAGCAGEIEGLFVDYAEKLLRRV
ncbi:hypothetical protein JKP88DRAFT_348742 [Tribonema minus]|uniref:Uncharacterized protein n=1 Tax=Tribonema minus TaxID=303371 RepID=A0A836CEG1_9STRA|nr:hypothetical protein JKP88DRAFT_348742 [Tribonema minus]